MPMYVNSSLLASTAIIFTPSNFYAVVTWLNFPLSYQPLFVMFILADVALV